MSRWGLRRIDDVRKEQPEVFMETFRFANAMGR